MFQSTRWYSSALDTAIETIGWWTDRSACQLVYLIDAPLPWQRVSTPSITSITTYVFHYVITWKIFFFHNKNFKIKHIIYKIKICFCFNLLFQLICNLLVIFHAVQLLQECRFTLPWMPLNQRVTTSHDQPNSMTTFSSTPNCDLLDNLPIPPMIL